VDSGEMSYFIELANPVSGTGCSSMQSGEFVTHRAPFRYRKLYA
jgi:hypothetical protein